VLLTKVGTENPFGSCYQPVFYIILEVKTDW